MHLTKGIFPCVLIKYWNMMQSVSLAEMFSQYTAADELPQGEEVGESYKHSLLLPVVS